MRYANELASGQPDVMLALLDDRPSFRSPFSHWTTRRACGPRTEPDARPSPEVVTRVVEQDGHAVVLWRGLVRGQEVEGCDVLAFAEHRIEHVDVFLRPAAVLPTVHAAMTVAWPTP